MKFANVSEILSNIKTTIVLLFRRFSASARRRVFCIFRIPSLGHLDAAERQRGDAALGICMWGIEVYMSILNYIIYYYIL